MNRGESYCERRNSTSYDETFMDSDYNVCRLINCLYGRNVEPR